MDQRMSAVEAMTLSVNESRIVHLPWSEVMHAELFASCDSTTESGNIEEFWGADNDDSGNGEWRVHLHRDEA